MTSSTSNGRGALSAFLREKRDQVTPQMVGLPVNGTRRVPGLRREEVAMLAGVSVDWYVRLEQGRPVEPSPEVVEAIADVLRLDAAERTYMANLARPSSTRAARPSAEPVAVRPGILRLLAGLENQPGFVLGPRHEVLAGNELAWALLHDFPAEPEGNRNLLRWILTDPAARELYLDWGDIVSDLVGVLQTEAAAAPNDPLIKELVGELSIVSPEFRERWARPAPEGRTSGTKRFRHPVVGELTIDWEAFTLQDDASQTVFVYMGRTEQDVERLRLLASWRATAVAAHGAAASADGASGDAPSEALSEPAASGSAAPGRAEE